MKNIICLVLVLNLNKPILICQNWRMYCNEWSAGDPIGTPIGDFKTKTWPENENLKTCGQLSIPFGVIFADLDNAHCEKGDFKKQFEGSSYTITFKTNSPDAGFLKNNISVPSVEVGIKFKFLEPNPNCPEDDYVIIYSESAFLLTNADWNGNNPIIVELRIKDNGGSFSFNCDSGNPKDIDFTKTFTINKTNVSPTSVDLDSPPSPANNIWKLEGALNSGVDFQYSALPSANSYEGLIVLESVGSPSAGLIFTMEDITTAFKNAHPNLLTPNQVAKFIFSPPARQSFAINANNKFTDSHAGFALASGLAIDQIFTHLAISTDKVGYGLAQKYVCCGTPNLGTYEVYRVKRFDAISKGRIAYLKKKT